MLSGRNLDYSRLSGLLALDFFRQASVSFPQPHILKLGRKDIIISLPEVGWFARSQLADVSLVLNTCMNLHCPPGCPPLE